MKYTTIDGTILESGPTPVNYTCPCENIPDGIYESFETTSANTPVGIQQIKIVRTVLSNSMTTVITESATQELEDYLTSLTEI